MAIGLAAGDVAGTITSMKVYELTESQMASLLVGMITSGGVSFGVTKLGKVSNVNLANEAGEIRIGGKSKGGLDASI